MKHSDLIARIRDEAKRGGKEFGAANAIAEFASFLSVIAEDADKTADKNLKVSKRNIRLQYGLIVISAITLIVAIIQLIFIFGA